jgi:hypothetical protein
VAVRWYLRYGLSYRDVEELLVERGVEADHVTVFRWVQRFTPLLADAALWVPESRSPHAACEYSPIKPPRRSRLTTRLPAGATGGWAGPNGGACPSERCGRYAL